MPKHDIASALLELSVPADPAAVEKAITRELESIREDVFMQVEQAEGLLRTFRKLLQRVDIVAKRHEDTANENLQLRATLLERDQELVLERAARAKAEAEAARLRADVERLQDERRELVVPPGTRA